MGSVIAQCLRAYFNYLKYRLITTITFDSNIDYIYLLVLFVQCILNYNVKNKNIYAHLQS